MVPTKEEMSVAKVFTHGGQTVVIYCVHKNPIFFELFDKIYPTVYTMWKNHNLLPVFTTWPPVFKKLAGGADLMLPGVVIQGEVTMSTFGKIQKGDMCVVNLAGNRAPVAVGQTCMSGEDMYLSAMRGKGVEVVHIVGDHLWEFGDKSDPPDLGDDVFGPLLQEALEEEANEEGDNGANSEPEGTGTVAEEIPSMENLSIQDDHAQSGGDNCAGAAGGVDEERETAEDADTEPRDLVGEMDQLLTTCCMCALKSEVKKSDLPLLTSTFFKNYMQPFCPVGQTIDVKKSSFKKLSKFLKQMQSKGYLKVKELTKGADSIVEVDRTHPELRAFQIPDVPREIPAPPVCEDSDYVPPVITEMFSITSAILPIFKSKGYNKNDALTAADLRRVITEYVKTHNLQDEERKSHVLLDPDLAHLVLTKQEGDLSHLRWDELFSRIQDKMQPAFQLQFPGQPPIVKKGKIEAIKLTVEQRASNKKATLIENLEQFGIDAQAFAHTIQKGVSCSCSVSPHHQKTRGLQVMVQGNQVAFIADLLLEKYKVPRKFVQGLEKAPKNKRR